MGAAAGSKKKATSATQWKRAAQGAPLDMPSGNTALVRPVGMQVFMQRGMIPNSLMPWVKAAINGEESKFSMDDFSPEQIIDVLLLVDAVTCFCVVEPKVAAVPVWTEKMASEGRCDPSAVGGALPPEERDDGVLYVDEVDEEDKMFIYQFVVGGTKDTESFRAQQAASLESLRAGADVGVPTK